MRRIRTFWGRLWSFGNSETNYPLDDDVETAQGNQNPVIQQPIQLPADQFPNHNDQQRQTGSQNYFGAASTERYPISVSQQMDDLTHTLNEIWKYFKQQKQKVKTSKKKIGDFEKNFTKERQKAECCQRHANQLQREQEKPSRSVYLHRVCVHRKASETYKKLTNLEHKRTNLLKESLCSLACIYNEGYSRRVVLQECLRLLETDEQVDPTDEAFDDVDRTAFNRHLSESLDEIQRRDREIDTQYKRELVQLKRELESNSENISENRCLSNSDGDDRHSAANRDGDGENDGYLSVDC